MATFQRDNKDYSSDYGDVAGYQDFFNKLVNQAGGMHSDSDEARSTIIGRLDSTTNQFKQKFENLVGRAPTNDEIGQFIQQSGGNLVLNAPGGRSETDQTNIGSGITQFIGDNFQKAAEQEAQNQLTAQQGQANSLADLFRKQGTEAINTTEQSLLDYQQKLFAKLRPNLITSLQAQGLLNTGGLNEAVAGAQQDLATEGSNYLRDARLNNEMGANEIAFSGASAPYTFKNNTIMNRLPYLQTQGKDALDRNYNTFLTNLNYQNQLGLAAYQNNLAQGNQPSFLKQMTNGIASAFNPLSASQAYNQYQQGSLAGRTPSKTPGMSF